MINKNKLGLGSVQFGMAYGISNTAGQTSNKEVEHILNVAFKNGITVIDTASSYGTSEEAVGNFYRHRFDIVSKFLPSSSGYPIQAQFENSLKNLKTDQLYGYLAHRPLELIAIKSDWEEIQALKATGKITKIGFSLNDVEEYDQLLKAGLVPDLIQVPFNYFDARFKEVMVELKAKGCEIHTRSTFLQGLFFLKTNQLSPFFEPFLAMLEELQEKYKDNLSASLLQYVLAQPFVDKVIIGVESGQQLEQNLTGLENAAALVEHELQFEKELLMPMHWPKK